MSRLAHVLGQLFAEERALLFGEPLDLLWEIWKKEEQNDRYHCSDDTLNDEHPAPASVTPITSHVRQTICQQTTEGTRQSSRTEEETESLLGFATLVPHAHQVKACPSSICVSAKAHLSHVYSHPGNIPASKTPKKNRVVINPPQFVTNPWQIITTPNMNIHSDTTPRRVSH
jgi:hypothetical protein